MVDYKDRLIEAMGKSTSARQIADALGISYQGVKKVIDGKSSAFSAENNSKVAAYLHVNPDWLATGTGSHDAAAGTAAAITLADCIARLATALQATDSTQREQAASLMQSLARDPAGPWSGWLAQLLNTTNSKSSNTETENQPIGDKLLHKLHIDTEGGGVLQIETAKVKRPSIFNLGSFDATPPQANPLRIKRTKS